jgi:enterobactin synthetase component D
MLGDGIAGSITHCYPWSVAVVAKCPNPVAIGVDLESMDGIQGTDISRLVCREAELAWVGKGDLRERLTMIFSAKEAIYKAFYPFCRRYIDFLEVVLTSCPEQYRLEGEFLAPLGPGLPEEQACAVHCVRHAELMFSCVIHKVQRNVPASSLGSLTHSVPLNRIFGSPRAS